jgi:addiction module HigA family antidote
MTEVKPIHPGVVISEMIEKKGITPHRLALALDVSPSTLTRIIKGQASVSPEMAYRLSKVIGLLPLTWLAYQAQCDIEKVKKVVDVNKLKRLM